MKSSYRRLGDYIHEVNTRNKELHQIPLLGVSITKKFIPSIANIVGTDMSTYKLIAKNQFAYGPVTSRNGDKISIALTDEHENAMVSQAYTVFDVNDVNEVLPDYLMMWFRRTEFDRYARFMSHGSAREIFSWAELCDTLLPIPSPEKQREIVKEYKVIQNRVALNNQLIAKLEEMAQTIYKQWFVDFEFPDENGKPYKSNGGEMEWCAELEKDVPLGWEMKSFSLLCDIGSSKRIYESEYQTSGIPFYRGKEITLKKNGLPVIEPYFISKNRFNELVKKYGHPNQGDILLTAVGTIGSTYMVGKEDFYFKDGNIIWLKNFIKPEINYYVYDFMQTKMFDELIEEITIGSTQSAITITTLNEQQLITPTDQVLISYVEKSKLLNQNRNLIVNENQKLIEINELLLARMTKVESEIETVEN